MMTGWECIHSFHLSISQQKTWRQWQCEKYTHIIRDISLLLIIISLSPSLTTKCISTIIVHHISHQVEKTALSIRNPCQSNFLHSNPQLAIYQGRLQFLSLFFYHYLPIFLPSHSANRVKFLHFISSFI